VGKYGLGKKIMLFLAGALLLLWMTAGRPHSRVTIYPGLSVKSTSAEGAKAFLLLLNKLGFHAACIQSPLLTVPPDCSVLFILSPGRMIEQAEADSLAAWVAQGGVLVTGGEFFRLNYYTERLELQCTGVVLIPVPWRLCLPVLLSPPVSGSCRSYRTTG